MALFALAVVAILAVALNFYLGMPQNAPRVAAFVSGVAQVPVSFGTVEVNLLKGAHLTDVKVANPAAPREPVLLSVPDLSLTYAPLALSQHRLLLRQVTLVRPVLALAEVVQGNTSLLPLPAAVVPQSELQGALRLNVKSLNIEDGTVRVLNAAGTPTLVLEGLQHGGRLERTGQEVKAGGQFTAKSLTLGPLKIGDLDSSYSFEKGVLKISKLLGTSYHGQWTGTFQIDGSTDGMPCDFQLQANSLDLNDLLKSVAAKPDMVSGTLNLTAAGRGSAGSLSGITAQGSFEVRDGQLIHVGFIQDLAQAISNKDLAQPDFSEAHGDFSVGQDTITVSSFALTSSQFTLTGGGTIGFDGGVNFKLTMTFTPDFAKLLPSAVVDRLTAAADGGRSITFSLTGPIDAPQSDLLKQLSFINLQGGAPAPAPASAPGSIPPLAPAGTP